jgi:hypothetical protein
MLLTVINSIIKQAATALSITNYRNSFFLQFYSIPVFSDRAARIGIVIFGQQLVRKKLDLGMQACLVIVSLLLTFDGLGAPYEKDIPVLATVHMLAGPLLLYPQ